MTCRSVMELRPTKWDSSAQKKERNQKAQVRPYSGNSKYSQSMAHALVRLHTGSPYSLAYIDLSRPY